MRYSHLLLFLLLAGFWPSSPAGAAEATAVRCGINEDRVWVYDSLIQFNVEAKLRCGETVEIIGRAKGYVKIRMRNGAEGYVLESAFPNLPPLVESNDQPGGNSPSAQQPQPRIPLPMASAPSNSVVTPARAVPVVSKNPVAIAENPSVANPVRSSETIPPATPVTPAASVIVNVSAPAVESAKPVASKAVAPEAVTIQSAPTVPVVPSAAPAPTERTQAVAENRPPAEITISTRPSDATSEVRPPVTAAVDPAADDSDDAEIPPETVHEDYSTCQEFFSAYGLTQAQFKWIVQNRKKKFPNVCPAPTVAMVDYVVIFTHDVDFYSSTMPVAVHTDQNGFSDFIPLMLMDSSLVSEAGADKARREYVWVFHTKRGAYNPAGFSPRRRPQFSKSASNAFGSHAGPRVVEDAFQFIVEHGTNR